MKLYTIIGGVNGCGKSSLTGALKAERSDLGLLIDVDKLAAQLGSPVEGGKAAVRKIDECLEKGISFTQETTLSGARTERTIRRAKERGYTIRLYYIGLDTMEESLGRIANRVAKGGHDIPKADVERRFQSRFTDVLRVLPYCDEARFFDNDNGFVEVAEYRNGELIPRVSNPPRWLLELMERVD
ncbi:MAG: zeta toxin family protein [Acutalibacter sp.]|nr:zeta toxin family protein [Candidatus Acutalibacter stercoravium]